MIKNTKEYISSSGVHIYPDKDTTKLLDRRSQELNLSKSKYISMLIRRDNDDKSNGDT